MAQFIDTPFFSLPSSLIPEARQRCPPAAKGFAVIASLLHWVLSWEPPPLSTWESQSSWFDTRSRPFTVCVAKFSWAVLDDGSFGSWRYLKHSTSAKVDYRSESQSFTLLTQFVHADMPRNHTRLWFTKMIQLITGFDWLMSDCWFELTTWDESLVYERKNYSIRRMFASQSTKEHVRCSWVYLWRRNQPQIVWEDGEEMIQEQFKAKFEMPLPRIIPVIKVEGLKKLIVSVAEILKIQLLK